MKTKEEPRTAFWVKDDGMNCPICNFKIGSCHVGCFCTNKHCPGNYVDGIARLTKKQTKKFKDIIIGPFVLPKFRKEDLDQ